MKNSYFLETAQPLQEGLPYWTFWLLLGVIVLLLFFIFLRDKELRRRIDFFFLSARNRSLQLHLHRQIKREKKRKEALWQQIGQITYKMRLSLPGTEALFMALDSLEAKRKHLETELAAIQENFARLETTKGLWPPAGSNEAAKGGEALAIFRKKRGVPPAEIKEMKAQGRFWKRRQAKIKEKIRDVEDHERAYFTTLGRVGDTWRLEEAQLQPLYDNIDQINLRLSHIEQRLDSLHPF